MAKSKIKNSNPQNLGKIVSVTKLNVVFISYESHATKINVEVESECKTAYDLMQISKALLLMKKGLKQQQQAFSDMIAQSMKDAGVEFPELDAFEFEEFLKSIPVTQKTIER